MTTLDALEITDGTLRDYHRLARFHYRDARPATCVRVLVARIGGSPVGVLTVSMPAINGPWRERVWPGRYTPRSPTRAERLRCLHALNAEVRVISRVIVDPRFRALGIARRLVRTCLDTAHTPHTEAVATMGGVCPIFIAAGMRETPVHPSRRVIRLRRTLNHLRIALWRLADPDALLAALGGSDRAELLWALRSFAAAHRDTRALAAADARTLVRLAARRVVCTPRAFVWARGWLLPDAEPRHSSTHTQGSTA